MKQTDQWELLELWERARDGRLTEEEQIALEQRILNDEEARTLLAEAALMEAELRHAGDDALPESVATSRRALTWRWQHGIAAAAAALVAAGLVWLSAKEPASVATLVKAHLCKWGNSALPTVEGSALRPGTLELVEGMATLKFKSGAEVVLEAPVSLEVVSAMECRVTSGTVVADVPHTAKGFTIQTPDTKVVDFGTRFGVSASDDGKCLVHVIEGDVEVSRPKDGETKHLKTGERADYGGWIKSRVTPELPDQDQSEPDRWLPGPIAQDRNGWQIITTAFGNGRDTCIQSNPGMAITGKEPFFRVKHTSLDTKLERKGYVAFDLSRAGGRAIEEAEFVLHLEPSDLGFGSLVPDAVFSVYGLTDEAQDVWAENGISWNDAPAHDQAADHHAVPVAGKVLQLGTFTVPQGSSHGSFTIAGSALTDWLNHDTNGVVTLIICRITDETARNGLVHAFATKENPRTAAPMLRIKFK